MSDGVAHRQGAANEIPFEEFTGELLNNSYLLWRHIAMKSRKRLSEVQWNTNQRTRFRTGASGKIMLFQFLL